MEEVKNLLTTIIWYISTKILLEIHLLKCFFILQAIIGKQWSKTMRRDNVCQYHCYIAVKIIVS